MALLQSGTRIYGVANVDTQIYVGSNVSINTTGLSVTGNATTIPTLSFYSNATAGVLTIGNTLGNISAAIVGSDVEVRFAPAFANTYLTVSRDFYPLQNS